MTISSNQQTKIAESKGHNTNVWPSCSLCAYKGITPWLTREASFFGTTKLCPRPIWLFQNARRIAILKASMVGTNEKLFCPTLKISDSAQSNPLSSSNCKYQSIGIYCTYRHSQFLYVQSLIGRRLELLSIAEKMLSMVFTNRYFYMAVLRSVQIKTSGKLYGHHLCYLQYTYSVM